MGGERVGGGCSAWTPEHHRLAQAPRAGSPRPSWRLPAAPVSWAATKAPFGAQEGEARSESGFRGGKGDSRVGNSVGGNGAGWELLVHREQTCKEEMGKTGNSLKIPISVSCGRN